MMRALTVLWILILAACPVRWGVAEETIRLASGEWPPYFSEHLDHFGVGSQIVSESFALVGVRVEYGFFPWKRSLKLAEAGVWDGTLGWEKNLERGRVFFVSDVVWEAPWVFFHLESRPFDWKDFDDLTGVRIGGTLGYMYSPELFEAERQGKIRLERAASDRLNLKKLLSGRIDLFPQLVDVGYFQLRALFDQATVERFTYDPRPLGKHADRLFLSRQNPRHQAMIERFNEGLRRLKASGRYEQYLDKLRDSE